MNNQKISIFFKSYESKEIIRMYFSPNTIIEKVLLEYFEKIHSIPLLSYFTFSYRGKALNKFLNKSLLDIFKRQKDPIIIVHKITGIIGAGDSIEFCDVSNGKKELINSNIIYGTPNKGINIYGLCQEKNCIAFNKEVVVPINKNYFDLLSEKHDLKCPKCNNIIIPNTVGFLQCEYKVKGKKRENREEFNFKEIADKSGKIKYYNSKENINGKAEMVELNFEITKYL